MTSFCCVSSPLSRIVHVGTDRKAREKVSFFFFYFFFHERNAGERICRSIRFDIRLVFSKNTGDFSECVSCEHAWNDTRPIYSPLSESSAFTKNHLDYCDRCNRRLAEKSKFCVSSRRSRLLGEKKKRNSLSDSSLSSSMSSATKISNLLFHRRSQLSILLIIVVDGSWVAKVVWIIGQELEFGKVLPWLHRPAAMAEVDRRPDASESPLPFRVMLLGMRYWNLFIYFYIFIYLLSIYAKLLIFIFILFIYFHSVIYLFIINICNICKII